MAAVIGFFIVALIVVVVFAGVMVLADLDAEPDYRILLRNHKMSNATRLILTKYKNIPKDARPEPYDALKARLMAMDKAYGKETVDDETYTYTGTVEAAYRCSKGIKEYERLGNSIDDLAVALAERERATAIANVRGIDIKSMTESIALQAKIVSDVNREFL